MEQEIKKDEYKCSCCEGIYKKGWSDEEMEAEAKDNFNVESYTDEDIVCDDCYNKIMPSIFN